MKVKEVAKIFNELVELQYGDCDVEITFNDKKLKLNEWYCIDSRTPIEEEADYVIYLNAEKINKK